MACVFPVGARGRAAPCSWETWQGSGLYPASETTINLLSRSQPLGGAKAIFKNRAYGDVAVFFYQVHALRTV